jgi:hypothetical protein
MRRLDDLIGGRLGFRFSVNAGVPAPIIGKAEQDVRLVRLTCLLRLRAAGRELADSRNQEKPKCNAFHHA